MEKQVLLLRLDAIGDFVLFTSVLPHLRQFFRNDHITLVVNPVVASLAEGCPYVDEIVSVDQDRYINEHDYAQQIAEQVRGKFDIAINTMYTRTRQSDNIIARTHAPVRIGFECIDKDGQENRRQKEQVLYTHLIRTSTEWMFELQRYEQLLVDLGIELGRQNLRPELWITEKERQWAEQFVVEHCSHNLRFAVLFPGAGAPIRYWSSESFARVADELITKHNLTVLIAGSETDRSLASEIISRMNQRAVDITGQTSLRHLVALMERAELFVGTESAGFHIAWTLGIPAIGIVGGGHFRRFTPTLPHVRIVHYPMDCYYCQWHCIYDEIKCITSITPDMVMNAVNEVLSLPEKVA